MDPELTAFLNQRFDAIDRRFDAVDQRFEGIDRRFDAIDQRFEGVDRRFDAMDGRLQAMDQRFDAMDQRLDGTRTEFGVLVERLRDEVHLVAEGHATLDRKIDRLRDENEASHREILTVLRGSYQGLDRRVSRLESSSSSGGDPAL